MTEKSSIKSMSFATDDVITAILSTSLEQVRRGRSIRSLCFLASNDSGGSDSGSVSLLMGSSC